MSIIQKNQINKLTTRWIRKTAGWWAFDPNIGPGITACPSEYDGGLMNVFPGDQNFHNGDQPADIMDEAFKDIEAAYIATWGEPPKPVELQAVFDFCFGGWSKRRMEDE